MYTTVHYVFRDFVMRREAELHQCNKSPLLSVEPQQFTLQWGSSTVPFLEILAQFPSLPGGKAASTPCQHLHLKMMSGNLLSC